MVSDFSLSKSWGGDLNSRWSVSAAGGGYETPCSPAFSKGRLQPTA